MELRVNEIAIPERISFNYEELKQGMIEKMHDYEMLVYTDDQIKDAKADKAALNKLRKSLNDERIRLERVYMHPFTEFKAQVNELISIIDKPIALIDQRVKEYEDGKKEAKRAEIMKYMEQFKLPYGIDIRMIWSEKWLNSTVTMKAVYQEIDERVTGIQADLETLEEMESDQDFAIACYRETLDLRYALNEVKRQKEARAIREKVEAERKQKLEATKPAAELPFTPEPETPAEPEKHWISFRALLTVEQARALKKFFNDNDISFTTV